MLEKLTKEQIEFQKKKVNEWVHIALHEKKYDEEKITSAVKWLYCASNLKEPEVVIVGGPEDFAKKIKASARDSVGDSVWASVWDSVGDSVGASVWGSVGDSVRGSVWASVWDSVGDSVGSSVRASVRGSVWDSVGASVWDSVRGSVWASVGLSSLCYDANLGAWYEYWKEIGAIQEIALVEKYMHFLRSGIFLIFLFEKTCFVMLRPTIVGQDDQKRLHSTTGPALAFSDGTEIYKLHGVKFKKEWWEKIKNDTLTPDEVFAIDNVEHRRIAYEYMDKMKMKQLKDYKVLDEKTDEKGNPMKVVSFTVQNMKEPLQFYNCICPSSGREYFLQVDKSETLEAKASLVGLPAKNVEWVEEW